MVINDIGFQYLDWDIANKIHGNGLPNVRRNMERLINVNFMIDRFSKTCDKLSLIQICARMANKSGIVSDGGFNECENVLHWMRNGLP